MHDMYEYVRSTEEFDSVKRITDIIADKDSAKLHFINVCFEKIKQGQEMQLHVPLLKLLILDHRLIKD